MSRERRLHPSVERYLGPVAIAQFIDIGWFTFWPIGVTKAGRNAFRNGYGLWDGNRQRLLYVTTAIVHDIGHPYPHWEGRLMRLPSQARDDNEDVSTEE